MTTKKIFLSSFDSGQLDFGFVGENNHIRYELQCDPIFDTHPDAEVSIKIQAPTGTVYPKTAEIDGTSVCWTVTDSDTASSGGGRIQITFTDDGEVIKSVVANTSIKSSLTGNNPPPDPIKDWISTADEILEQSAGIEKSVSPETAEGLNFSGTSYEAATGYNTVFFPVTAGATYRVKCYGGSGEVEYKHIFSTASPAANVSGTLVRTAVSVANTYRPTDYTAEQAGFYGIVSAGGSVEVTEDNGILAGQKDFTAHTLTPEEFTQGSCSNGMQYTAIADCVAQKDFYNCSDIDKIFFDDPSGLWKIRVCYFDGGTNYLKQIGYGFLTEINVPSEAVYCKIAVSHYNSQGSSVPTTPGSIVPGTLKISARSREQAKADLIDSEYDLIENTGNGYLHADFVNGVLSRGSVYAGAEQYYRICSDKKFVFDRDIVLVPDSGYQFGIHSFGTSGAAFVSDSGWITKPYVIPAGEYFKIVIQKTAATNAEIANANENVKAVKVYTKISQAVDMVSGVGTVPYNISDGINYAVNDNASSVFTAASGYQAKYYCVDAGKTYGINITMGENAGYIRFAFSEKIPAANVVAEFDREIYFRAGQNNAFFIKPDKTGYFSIINHTYYPYTNTFQFAGLSASKSDAGIPVGLIKHEYFGEKIDIGYHVAPEALFVINDGIPIVDGEGVNRARQGAAAYGDILFVGYNGGEYISMHNLVTKRHICNVVINSSHTATYHCNNICFGSERYAPEDPFPLLYVAMENPAERKSLVYRITGSGSSYSGTLVQTITYPPQTSDGMWYPNGFTDPEHGYFYIHGYTENSFYKSATNKIKIVKYTMPLLSAGDVQLNYADRLSEFTMDSYTATQGCVVYNGIMYQCNGFGETDNNIVKNSLEKGRTVTSISLIEMGIEDEPEAAFIWRNWLCFYTVRGYVYRLHFEG